MRRTRGSLLPPAIAFALVLVAWEMYSQLVLSTIPGGESLLPAPTRIVQMLFRNAVVLAPHTWLTLLETLAGFTVALLVGLGLALIIDLSPLLRRGGYPLAVVWPPLPPPAPAPPGA